MAVASVVLAGDVPTAGCANDCCVIKEALPSIVGIVENISSPTAKVSSLFLKLDLNIYYRFRKSHTDIYGLKKTIIESKEGIMI
jgi:hypothetical protein